jgi:hypothetical protein
MTAGDIYLVAGSGQVSLGDGGPAAGASLWQPAGVAPGPANSLLIAGSGDNRIREVSG